MRLRRVAGITGVTAALGYGGAAGYLRLNERALVYHPDERAVAPPPPALELRQRTVFYRSGDGTSLSAWIVPAARADSAGGWMLVCHGNYGNIGYGQRPEFYAWMRDLGLNLLAFDYRGFGESAGLPVERGLYADAEASYYYLRDSLGVVPERIIIFGHSLGTGVAIELATRVSAAGLVVEGAYTSVPDRGQELYPWLPVKLVASQRFASIEKVGRLSLPKLLLHSPSDDVIPYAHGQRLFAAAAGPKEFVAVEGGHMDAYSVDREKYYGAIGAFARRLWGGATIQRTTAASAAMADPKAKAGRAP